MQVVVRMNIGLVEGDKIGMCPEGDSKSPIPSYPQTHAVIGACDTEAVTASVTIAHMWNPIFLM